MRIDYIVEMSTDLSIHQQQYLLWIIPFIPLATKQVIYNPALLESGLEFLVEGLKVSSEVF